MISGDHQQLRPTSSVYELSKRYNMDISLFERMINNDINCVTLKQQYRMHPDIANLIRPTIYKELVDAQNVFMYPPVAGVNSRVYFLNHTNPESGVRLSLF